LRFLSEEFLPEDPLFFLFILGGSKRSFAKTGSGQATKKGSISSTEQKAPFFFTRYNRPWIALANFRLAYARAI
jgi:hypothetical protein